MRIQHHHRRTLLLLLCLAPLPALALSQACHRLMTEQECGAHLDKLASLPEGAPREFYLTEFEATRIEREKACLCNRFPVEPKLGLLQTKTRGR